MRGTVQTGRVCGAAVAALLVVSVVLSGCPLTEREYVELKAPMDELAAKVARLERALAEVQKVGPAPSSPAPDAQVRRRVEEQGKSLADLRAKVDELSAQTASLSGKIEALEKGGAGDRESVRAGVGQVETRLSALEKRVEQMQAAVRSAEVPRPNGPAPPAAGDKVQAPPLVEKRSPHQILYEEAYDLYRKQGKYEESREKFKALIQTYPEAPLVPNAYFWIGESYYDQAQYEPAILEYDNVIKKFPKSDKVPSALLKEAFAFDKLSDPVSARALLKKLLRDYPKSDQAGIAQKKLDSLGD